MGTKTTTKTMHRHPDDARPTEKIDPTRLFALRIEGALRDRPHGGKAHPGLLTAPMKPLARASRPVILTEALDPADVLSIEDIPPPKAPTSSGTQPALAVDDDDERPTTAIAPLTTGSSGSTGSRPRIAFDPTSMFWSKTPTAPLPLAVVPESSVSVMSPALARGNRERGVLARIPLVGGVAMLFAACLRWFL